MEDGKGRSPAELARMVGLNWESTLHPSTDPRGSKSAIRGRG